MSTYLDGKWVRRNRDRSIDLEAQFEHEFYPPTTEQRAFLNMVETIEPVFHKQAAATIITTAHFLFSTRLYASLVDSNQQELFHQSRLQGTLDRKQ